MRNVLILLFLTLIYSYASGQESKNSFLVTDKSVGVFYEGMTVNDVLELVNEDQIKKVIDYDSYESLYDDYQYFDFNQNHLLTLTPKIQNDKNSQINRVLIIDEKYVTDRKIGLSSTYGDLKANYEITDYSPDLDHIVLTVEKINAWFTINKNQLLENWWDDDEIKIDKSKIPDNATFDSFVIWWN